MLNQVDNGVIEELFKQASDSSRLRAHLELHSSHADKVQRILIALIKGTVVEPHYHVRSDQWEMICCLEGAVDFVTFNDQGREVNRLRLGADEEALMVQVDNNVIHTIECISERAMLLEVKEGPYRKDVPPVFPFRH